MGRHIARIVSGIARQIKQMVRTDAQFFVFESHAYINCRRHVFKINHLIIQQVQIICQEHTMGKHGPTDKKDGAHNSNSPFHRSHTKRTETMLTFSRKHFETKCAKVPIARKAQSSHYLASI